MDRSMLETMIVEDRLHEWIPIRTLPERLPAGRNGKPISLQAVYSWIQTGKLRTVKVGGARYVTVEALADFLSAGRNSDVKHATSGKPTRGARIAGQELDKIFGRN